MYVELLIPAAAIVYAVGYYMGQRKAKRIYIRDLRETVDELNHSFIESLRDVEEHYLRIIEQTEYKLYMSQEKPSMSREDQDKCKALIHEAVGITDRQLQLWRQLDVPNRGASHARWKQDLIAQIKELDKEKLDKFQKILNYGFDPEVSVIKLDGEKESMKISELLKEYKKLEEESTTATPTPPPPPVKKNDRITSRKGLHLLKPDEGCDDDRKPSKTNPDN